MIVRILLVVLVSTTVSLHTSLHQAMKRYSENKELKVLKERQDNFKMSLLQIKGQIDDINKILTNQNATSGYKLTKLQQTMADERDSLFKVQEDLILPFNLMKCECLSLTNQKASEIRNKMNTVQTHIKNLEATITMCNQCPDLDLFKEQIRQSKIYVNAINETINSQCCWAPKVRPEEKVTGLVNLNNSYFKNNLNAKNWYYGQGTTEDNERYKTFMKSTQYNLTACQIDKPFVMEENNTCFDCPPGGAYNIGNKTCSTCKPWQFFDVAEEKCQFCGKKQIYNTTLKKCAKCPKGYKFDNTSKTGCSVGQQPKETTTNGTLPNKNITKVKDERPKTCPQETPYLNPVTNKCEQCRVGTFYSPKDNQCVVTNYIGLCPQSLPFFNIHSNRCQTCPVGSGYNPSTYHCETGFVNNNQQKKNNTSVRPNGTKNNTTTPSNTSTSGNPGSGNGTKSNDSAVNPASKCTIEETYINQTKKCVLTKTLCTIDEYYNQTLKQCLRKSSRCQVDQVYDTKTKLCKKVPFITSPYVFNLLYPHENFTKYIELYKQSKKSNSKLQDCPMSTPYFSPKLLKCINCPQDQPLFSLQSGQCESCPHPTVYNPSKYKCENLLAHQSIDHMLDHQ